MATAKRNNHVDLHAALGYLRREPAGTKVKVPCPNELYMKKYYALNAAADKSGLRLKTKWKNGWLYVMKTEKGVKQ